MHFWVCSTFLWTSSGFGLTKVWWVETDQIDANKGCAFSLLQYAR